MGAAAGFDAQDAVGFEGLVTQEEVGVFAGVNVVGDDGDVVMIAEGEAQLAQQCGFTGAYRAPYSNSQAMFHGDFLLSVSCGGGVWSVSFSGTRREYVPVGSSKTSVFSKVPEKLPDHPLRSPEWPSVINVLTPE